MTTMNFIKGLIEKFLDPSEGTRFKFGIGLAVLMAIEAGLNVVWNSFPLATVCGFQAGLYVTFVTGKTTNNANYAKTNGDSKCTTD